MKSPCLNCTDRIIGCHSKCDPYITYTEWNHERSKNKEVEHEISNATYDIRQQRFDKNGRLKARRKYEI